MLCGSRYVPGLPNLSVFCLTKWSAGGRLGRFGLGVFLGGLSPLSWLGTVWPTLLQGKDHPTDLSPLKTQF